MNLAFQANFTHARRHDGLRLAVSRIVADQAVAAGDDDRFELGMHVEFPQDALHVVADSVGRKPQTLPGQPVGETFHQAGEHVDFPGGGERLTAEEPTGVRHVLVNGTPIRRDGSQLESLETQPGMRPAIA